MTFVSLFLPFLQQRHNKYPTGIGVINNYKSSKVLAEILLVKRRHKPSVAISIPYGLTMVTGEKVRPV